MPRTLPWLTQAAKNDAKSSSSPAPANRRKRERDSSPPDLVDADLNDIDPPSPRPRPKQPHRAADRTPSTSPPPAPPSVAYMRPGYHADDIYMMVEDEFHQTAKEYTAHIHRDEYLRLRKLARSRGEKTLEALEHGTDGGRTEVGKALLAGKEREALGRRRREALGVEDEEEDDEELPFMQDPQLAGLMTREKGERLGRDLVGMAKAKSNTRAAAGFMESPHAAKRHRDALKEEKDVEERVQKRADAKDTRAAKVFEEVSDEADSDDLDAVPAARPPPRKSEGRKTATGDGHDALRANKPDRGERSGNNIFKRFAAPSKDPRAPPKDTRRDAPSPSVKIEDGDNDLAPRPKPTRPTYKKAQIRQAFQALHTQSHTFDASPRKPSTASGMLGRPSPPRPQQSTTSPHPSLSGTQEAEAAAAGYLAKRAADRARKEKEAQGRARRVDDIPTFLF